MLNKIILASKSKIRKQILEKNNIKSIVEPSNVDEDIVKINLLKKKASPEIISKNLAELKANKVSMKKTDEMVLGADSVIDLGGELISKPGSREEAMDILKKLNGKSHFLISSVCISNNGSMIWNYTDLENIKKEVLNAKRTFQKYKWPLIDVTRKSVEETAASIIKIHEIYLNNAK